MNKPLFKSLQGLLLAGAVLLVGSAFLPAESQADPPACSELTSCQGGNDLCATVEKDGQYYACTQPIFCI